MKGLLDGDVAVVTGAARGNGLEIARGLAEAGAAVALLDVDRDEAEARAGANLTVGALRAPVDGRKNPAEALDR